MKTITLVVAFLGLAAQSYAVFEAAYAFQNPTQIINSFRDSVFVTTLRLKNELKVHQEIVEHLKNMLRWQDEKDEEIDDMTSSITTLMLDLPNLYTKAKNASDTLVENVKKLTELRNLQDQVELGTFKAYDEVFDRLREIMTNVGAKEEDLPPQAWETMGDLRNKTEYNYRLRLRQERRIYDIGMEFYKTEIWEEAHKYFWQAYEAYNISIKAGSRVTVDLLTIQDHVQYTAYKSGNLQRAYDVAMLIANNDSWNEDVRTRHAQNAQFYKEQMENPTPQSTETTTETTATTTEAPATEEKKEEL